MLDGVALNTWNTQIEIAYPIINAVVIINVYAYKISDLNKICTANEYPNCEIYLSVPFIESSVNKYRQSLRK